jgi:23S rRNA (uracil1939-C5)-methyltransferase
MRDFKKKKYREPQILKNVLITDAGSEGKAVGKHDGMVVFVPYGAPGDMVDIEVSFSKRNYAEGRIIELHSASPFRQEPFCKHFGICGGCKWQHLQYRHQLSAKQKHVKDNLQRIAKVENMDLLPIIGADETKHYRNKLEYTFGDKRWLTHEEIKTEEKLDTRCLGYHLPGRFDKLIHIDECFLQASPSDEIRNAMMKFVVDNNIEFFNLRFKTGFARNLIIRSNKKGDVMLIWVVFEERKEIFEKFVSEFSKAFPQITSMYVAINSKLNDSLEGVPFIHLHGNTHLTETIGELQFQIAPASFFQTNSTQAEKLYSAALKMAELEGNELMYDLYSGTATIAAFFAKHVKKVIGVEFVESAVIDGKENLAMNNIDNVELFHGDMTKMFRFDWVKKHGFPDIVVTDPPRAGMTPAIVETMLAIRPKKIVYISCNPATQARDIADMTKEYTIVKVQTVDMFPQTHHVENIVVLHRNDIVKK